MERRTQDGMCEVDSVDDVQVGAARASLPPKDILRELAQTMKVFSHPSRLKVLHALNGRELCVCDLAQVLGLSMSGTSQQLKELRRVGAIDFRTQGKLVYYGLADAFWLDLTNLVAKHLGFEVAASKSQKKKSKRNPRS